MNQTNPFRILSIALTSRGFGYAVLEGRNSLIGYGVKTVKKDRNVNSLFQIEKIIIQNQPDVLIMHDVNAKGVCRHPRIKKLDRQVIDLAKRHKLKTTKISGIEVRRLLLGNLLGTKHEIAELVAKRFPDELASRLPPKRKAWNSEDRRMDIFDAVALISAFQANEVRRI